MKKQIKPLSLGELLVKRGIITSDDLLAVLEEQKRSHMRFPEILIRKGYITEAALAEEISKGLGLPLISISDFNPGQPVLSLIPENVAERLKVIPLSAPDDGTLTVAMSDPMDAYAIDEIRMLTNRDIDIKVAAASEIRKAIMSRYRIERSLMEAISDVKIHEGRLGTAANSQASAQDVSSISVDDAPVIRLLNTILEQAVREGASDVHIEPSESNTRVRMRIDGVLMSCIDIPKNLHLPLLARIKILSDMDISEKRRPQDGRILIMAAGRRIDLRVSVMPSVNGEKAVLRLLVQENCDIGMEKLGFDEEQTALLKASVSASHGIVLSTGPTGSGKSTTLYSLLEIINKPEVNIITVEDPVEYSMSGITQIQINEKIGLTFGGALRSILRQDPDKLMIGEIRDTETAHLAVRAALTGHLVLSTLHTNDAPGAIDRLADMGVPKFLLASSIRAIAAQRLVRKLCPVCKRETVVSDEMSRLLGLLPGSVVYAPNGCGACRFTGYNGRTLIAEVMVADPGIREMIGSAAQIHELREYSRANGMTTLRESALKKLRAGITGIEEILLATMSD